jgi:hypothetical protein
LRCAGTPKEWKSFGAKRKAFMFQEELRKLTEENLKWLATLVPTLPELAFIEPVVQSLALINKDTGFSEEEMMIIGVAGIIATKARIVDEKRFQELTPNEYFQHAYILLKIFKKEEPSEEEYLNTIKKLYK